MEDPVGHLDQIRSQVTLLRGAPCKRGSLVMYTNQCTVCSPLTSSTSRFSDMEESQMKKILIQYGVYVLVVALMVPLAQAQAAEVQAAFGKDAGTLSDKFTALARVMAGKYDWRPGPGVRSVGEVFNLIVTENRLLVGVLSGTPHTGAKPAPITDPEKLQEALKASYIDLQKAITGLSDNDLQAS